MGKIITHTKTQIVTMVPSACASACVLVFAAGDKLVTYSDSKIGVHSVGMYKVKSGKANGKGIENASATFDTVLTARYYAELGVPYSVIGKMAATATDDMMYVDAIDLNRWGVTVIPR